MIEVLYTLLEINLYACVIWAVTLLLKKLAAGHISPRLNLIVWTLFIARLLCPVTFDCGIHLIPAVEDSAQVSVADSARNIQPESRISDEEVPWTPSEEVAAHHPGGENAAAENAQNVQPSGHISNKAPASVVPILFWIWIGGMVVALGVTIAELVRLRRNVLRTFEAPGAELSQIFAQCCRELEVRRRPRLVTSASVRGPALIFPNTVVFPPDADSMDKQDICRAIMHEIMHYKRKDPLLSLLLLALRIIHWFDPVVWIATNQIRQDMETACDSDVVQGWTQTEKADYARTILLFYGARRHREGVLALAADQSAKSAEKRIRGIFMKSKSSRSIRAVALLATIVLAVACFTTACQSVPKRLSSGQGTENLVQTARTKLTSAQTAAVSEPPKPTPAEVPQVGVIPSLTDSGTTWKGQVTLPDGTIDVNASVFTPDTDTLPVYRIEQNTITPELARQVAQTLWGEDMPEMRVASVMTKEERDDTIEFYRNLIRKYQEEGPDPDEDMTVEERIAQWEGIIESTETIYQDALADDTQKAADFSFYYNPKKEQTGFDYDLLFSDGTTGKFNAAPADPDREEENCGGISYQSDAWYNRQCAGFSQPLDTAIAEATAIVDRLGAGTFTLTNAEVETDMGWAAVEFQAAAENVPMIDRNLNSATHPSMMTEEQSEAYSNGEFELPPALLAESITVYMDDNGLAGFFWDSPWTIVETVGTPADLLSVEEAGEIFASGFPENNGDSIPADEIGVDRIELGYTYTFAKDAPGEYRLIPVYDFIGTTTMYSKEPYPMSFMTINAIDGTIHNRDEMI